MSLCDIQVWMLQESTRAQKRREKSAQQQVTVLDVHQAYNISCVQAHEQAISEHDGVAVQAEREARIASEQAEMGDSERQARV